MTTDRASADKVVDLVWSRALGKILKGEAPVAVRPGLGEEIDLTVPQASTAAMLSHIPAFTKLLYNAGYAASSRNAYLVLRRVGMPSDFFWKFDYWDEDRAFETLDKVINRIFTALMAKQNVGELRLVSVDGERGRFELSFAHCAECAGFKAPTPMCFYHTGSFAGILSAMLDRELDGYESECVSTGGDVCRFIVGNRDDRQIARGLDEWLAGFSGDLDVAGRISATLGTDTGTLVDVGYYQLLLASSYLTNMDVVERACLEAGESIGAVLAGVVQELFPGEPLPAVEEFYRRLRYTSITITPEGDGYRVELDEAPEVLEPLSGLTVVPFLPGELAGLLGALGGQQLRVIETETSGTQLRLLLAP